VSIVLAVGCWTWYRKPHADTHFYSFADEYGRATSIFYTNAIAYIYVAPDGFANGNQYTNANIYPYIHPYQYAHADFDKYTDFNCYTVTFPHQYTDIYPCPTLAL